MALITKTVLGANAATIDFTSIPGTYNHLLVVYSIRSAVAAETVAQTAIRFNNDSGANYYYQNLWTQANTASGGSATGQTSMKVLLETGPSADANTFASGQVLIPFYATGTRLREAIGIHHLIPTVSANTNWFTGQLAGSWNNTAAITRLTIFASDLTSNLVTGSAATLYGIT